MAKSIEINYNTGSGYEVLYPKVMMNNIGDWRNNVYNKSEIDNKFSNLSNTYYNKTEINNKLSNLSSSGWKKLGTYSGTNSQNIVIGYQWDYWRKEIIVILDKIQGSFVKIGSGLCTVSVDLWAIYDMYIFSNSSSDYLQNFTNYRKPFLYYRPSVGRGMGVSSSKLGGDGGMPLMVSAGNVSLSDNFTPQTWGTYYERPIIQNDNQFLIKYRGINKRESSLSAQVSVYTRDLPIE